MLPYFICRNLKDQYSDMTIDPHSAPTLLNGILMRNPDAFKGKYGKLLNNINIYQKQ